VSPLLTEVDTKIICNVFKKQLVKYGIMYGVLVTLTTLSEPKQAYLFMFGTRT